MELMEEEVIKKSRGRPKLSDDEKKKRLKKSQQKYYLNNKKTYQERNTQKYLDKIQSENDGKGHVYKYESKYATIQV